MTAGENQCCTHLVLSFYHSFEATVAGHRAGKTICILQSSSATTDATGRRTSTCADCQSAQFNDKFKALWLEKLQDEKAQRKRCT
eukprot:3285074-Pleurochrysis_carterae.AAC.1